MRICFDCLSCPLELGIEIESKIFFFSKIVPNRRHRSRQFFSVKISMKFEMENQRSNSIFVFSIDIIINIIQNKLVLSVFRFQHVAIR